MSNRYAPLPNPSSDPDTENELDAAFDDSDDEEDHPSTSYPLRSRTVSVSQPAVSTQPPLPGTYNFENYDFPPPGSPPLPPSTIARSNNHGNSNGHIPSFDVETVAAAPRKGWFRRTVASILPSHYVQQLGL